MKRPQPLFDLVQFKTLPGTKKLTRVQLELPARQVLRHAVRLTRETAGKVAIIPADSVGVSHAVGACNISIYSRRGAPLKRSVVRCTLDSSFKMQMKPARTKAKRTKR